MHDLSREYPQRPLVGIGVVVFRRRGSEVLLIKRGRAPAQGEWSFPGGAQRVGETAQAAARRELKEETGIEAGALRLVTYADSIHRDASQRVQFHYTILEFSGVWLRGEPRAGGDAAEAAWAPLSGLDRFGLAADISRVILACKAVLFEKSRVNARTTL
jgi:ADP-ribose pyrophosphatase YjhB (NUDIX family)